MSAPKESLITVLIGVVASIVGAISASIIVGFIFRFLWNAILLGAHVADLLWNK